MYRSLWIDDEVAALRDMARKFFDTEGAPNRERWEQQQHVDREFWLKAAKLGLLCAAIPVEYGGGGGPPAHGTARFAGGAARLLTTWLSLRRRRPAAQSASAITRIVGSSRTTCRPTAPRSRSGAG